MHIKDKHKYQQLPKFLLILFFFLLNFTVWLFIDNSNYTLDSNQYPHYPKPIASLDKLPNVFSFEENKSQFILQKFKELSDDSLKSHSLPIISLSGTNNSFFGPTGLYAVNSNHPKYQSVKAQIQVELLNFMGKSIFKENAKAQVAGVSTKSLPLKSLNIHFQEKVNSELLFTENESYLLKSIRLRNAGNDFLLAYMRDNVVRDLAKNTHLISLRYQPVTVLINGEFWGIQYIRERVNEDLLIAKYPELGREQIVLGELKKKNILALSKGFRYLLGDLTQLIDNHNLNLPEYQKKLEAKLNLNNFIDYIVFQTFISNTDWPHNNVKCAFLNGQLHFILYDTDFSLGYVREYFEHTEDFFNLPDRYYQVNEVNHPFLDSLDFYVPTYVGRMHQSLMKYDFYQKKYLSRYRELLLADLSQKQVVSTVRKIREQISPIMPAHIARWGSPSSAKEWEYHTEQIVRFCEERRAYILKELDLRFSRFSAKIPQGISSEESP